MWGKITNNITNIIILGVVGLLLWAMTQPTCGPIREQGKVKAITNNLRQIASAGQQYLLEDSSTNAVGYTQMVGDYFGEILPIEDEDYGDIIIHREGGVLRRSTTSGIQVTFTYGD